MSSTSKYLCRVLRRRSLSTDMSLKTELSRCLSVYQLVLYGVAHMAGAGVYVLTGTLIADTAGTATSISFLMAAFASVFTALCYAEFATLIPRAGSVYAYTYLMLGELPAFIIGWTTVSDFIVSMAAVTKGFSGTVDLLLNNTVRDWTIQHIGRLPNDFIFDDTLDLIAFGFLIFLMLLTLTGANCSVSIAAGLSVIQVLCLMFVVVACFMYGNVDNLASASGGFAPNGMYGVISAATIAVFAFSGFESIANASEETADPKRSIPLALLGSLLIITILYFMASIGLSYLVPRDAINISSPFVAAFGDLGVIWMKYIAAFGTLLATGATKLAVMYIIPRVFYALASDGLLFSCFAYIEPRTKTPLAGLFTAGILAAVLAMLLNIQTLADFTSMGILFSYYTIGLDLVLLRYYHKKDLLQVEYNESQSLLRPQFQALGQRITLLRSEYGPGMAYGVFSLSSFCMAITVDYFIIYSALWVWLLVVITAVVVLASFIVLCFYQPGDNQSAFQTPWMPLAPCATSFVNIILIVKLDWLTWIRFLIWTSIGMVIYFAYGYQHSELNENGGENMHLLETKDESKVDSSEKEVLEK